MKINEYGLESKEYTLLYATWRNIKRRCTDSRDKEFHCYGARGITICNEWNNDFHCYARWALNNGWCKGMSIERIDVNGNYEPSNCTFIPMSEQHYNKTNTVWVEYNGERRSLAKLCKELGVNSYTVSTRRNRDGVTELTQLLAPPMQRAKAVIQMDKNGVQIGEYASIKEASVKTGILRTAINNALKGYCTHSGGYTWKYKGE